MDQKLRAGAEVMSSYPHAGVSPNPASTLHWPMSYSSPVHSFDRSPLPNLLVPATSTGTRYDPVRHHDQKSQPQIAPDLDQQHEHDTGHAKRKRLDTQQQQQQHPLLPMTTTTAKEAEYSFRYEPQKVVTPTNSLQSGKRNHVCDICGATFTRQHNLKSHFLTHTSSKKEFICLDCGSEFRRSHDLKRHQKLHTGEKPFACSTCGRRFARADALGRHAKSSSETGCVNSRKAPSDPGSTADAQHTFQLISPSDSYEEHGHSDEHRGTLGPSSEGDMAAHHPLLEPRIPANNRYAHQPDAQEHRPMDGQQQQHKDGSHTQASLPSLSTGFSFDHHSQSFANGSTSRAGMMTTPRFGPPASFDTRTPSTHPLSYDRGSMPEHSRPASAGTAASIGAAGTGPQNMVPLQTYRQLEAEHHAAMERIRHFEQDHG